MTMPAYHPAQRRRPSRHALPRAGAAASLAVAASGLALEFGYGPGHTPATWAGQGLALVGAAGLITFGVLMTRVLPTGPSRGRHRVVAPVRQPGVRRGPLRRLGDRNPWRHAGTG